MPISCGNYVGFSITTYSLFSFLNLMLITAVTFFCSALPQKKRTGDRKKRTGDRSKQQQKYHLNADTWEVTGATLTLTRQKHLQGMDYFLLHAFLEVQSLGLVSCSRNQDLRQTTQKGSIDSKVHEIKLKVRISKC